MNTGDQMCLALLQAAFIQEARRLCRGVDIAKRRLRASQALRIRIVPPALRPAPSAQPARLARRRLPGLQHTVRILQRLSYRDKVAIGFIVTRWVTGHAYLERLIAIPDDCRYAKIVDNLVRLLTSVQDI